ncbi:transposase family protein [Micromonospora sp. CPCC 206060]|uniref:transposase family protein n=1 Tax=Micromonospora sp. CPCC 206060 TaxID=3122406 RepID=UPI002FF35E76
MIESDTPTGRPQALPLHTALVMVLFALRHNLPPDILSELFGCGSSTVERYQDELEVLIDVVLTPLYEQMRAQGRQDLVPVDGLVVPIGERDGAEGLVLRWPVNAVPPSCLKAGTRPRILQERPSAALPFPFWPPAAPEW